MALSAALTARIRAEFTEMPGLKLTLAQASRLWNLNERVCREALDALIAEGFLYETPSGAFIALPSAVKMLKATAPDPRPSRCPYCQHLNSVHLASMVGPHGLTTYRCAACGRIVTGDAALSA